VHSLTSMGISADVLMSSESIRLKGNIFGLCNFSSDFKENNIYSSAQKPLEALQLLLGENNYDYLYINTFADRMADFWLSLDTPVLAVCHNVDSFGLENAVKLLDKCKLNRIIVLWDHVASDLKGRLDRKLHEQIMIHYPIIPFIDKYIKQSHASSGLLDLSTLRLCIPGRINYRSRDYRNFFEVLRSMPLSTIRACALRLVFPGGFAMNTKEAFERDISALPAWIQVEAPELSKDFNESSLQFSATHEAYYTALLDSDFVLPLLKHNSRYETRSITSSVPAALSVRIPLGLGQSHSVNYGVPYSLIGDGGYHEYIARIMSGMLLSATFANMTKEYAERLVKLNARVCCETL
jgi:hypothetical protein